MEQIYLWVGFMHASLGMAWPGKEFICLVPEAAPVRQPCLREEYLVIKFPLLEMSDNSVYRMEHYLALSFDPASEGVLYKVSVA